MTCDLGALIRSRSVAVVGANDDLTTFGGRIWHYLGQYSRLERFAVNVRLRALDDVEVAPTLSELSSVPDVVVLATPSSTISDLVAEAISVGSKGIVVFAQVAVEDRPSLRRIVDDHGITLLGPSSLGLIDINDGVVLSSSVSLERRPRRGPLALVAQSGALMGVLHARAIEQGIGLGFSVATGSQLQLRVEDVLGALSDEDGYLAVGAHLEDINVESFVAAAEALERAGCKLIVLKGGLTSRGGATASGHSGALASDGRAFRALANDLGVVVADDAQELLACMQVASIAARSWHVATISGGVAAIAADLATNAGINLPAPVSGSSGLLSPSNPIDLDALPATPEENVAVIESLTMDAAADGVVLVLNDEPGLDRLLSGIGRLDSGIKERLHVCSECSGQFDGAWQELVDAGGSYSKRFASFVSALAKTRESGPAPTRLDPPRDTQLLSMIETRALLEQAEIPVLETVPVDDSRDLDAIAVLLKLPFVLKLAEVEHRGDAGVVIVTSLEEAKGAFDHMSENGAVVAQPVAVPGLEFYFGVKVDEVFGELFVIGAGGPSLEERGDVSVGIGVPDRDAVLARLKETVSGGWLSSGSGGRFVDLEALAEVARRVGALAISMRPALVSMDLNPVIVNSSGAIVIDAKLHVNGSYSRGRAGFGPNMTRRRVTVPHASMRGKPLPKNSSSIGFDASSRWLAT